MARIKKRTFEKEYVQIPNETARAVEAKNENPISLEAFGLIANLFSYPDTWELNKTELYKRFAFNKETSVRRVWKELMKAGYIIEYKYRNGNKWEYEYVFDIVPYTEEQRKIIFEEAVEEYGEISGLDFEVLKTKSPTKKVHDIEVFEENEENSALDFEVLNLKTSNGRPQDKDLINTVLKKDRLNKYRLKDIDDDEKGENFEVNNYAFKKFVKEFEANHPNFFDNELYNAIYDQMHKQQLELFTYKEAVRQAKYMEDRQNKGELTIGDYAAYFVGGIKKKRTSQANALAERKRDQAKKASEKKKEKEEKARKERIEKLTKGETVDKQPYPFYNWLDE